MKALPLVLLLAGCDIGPLEFQGPEMPFCFQVDSDVERKLPHVYESMAIAADELNVEFEAPGLLLECPHRIFFGTTYEGACVGPHRLTLSESVCLATDYYEELHAPEVPLCDEESGEPCCDEWSTDYYLDNVLIREFGLLLGVTDETGVMGNPQRPCSREVPSSEQIAQVRR